MILKRCCRGDRCIHPEGPMLPATTDYFQQDRTRKDGLHASCKVCYNTRKVQGYAKKRFLAGTGTRYMKSGKVRCHGVARHKIRTIRERENNPDLTPDECWPEAQCGLSALRGHYLCNHHLTNPGGRKVADQAHDVFRFLKGDIADKYRIAVNDPELFDQRKNVALLSARNAELFEDINAAGLSMRGRVDALHKVMSLIDKGEVTQARTELGYVLDALTKDTRGWDEIRKNMTAIKDLSNAEMTRQKEMRQSITTIQAVAMMEKFTSRILAAVEKYVEDDFILEGIYKEVVNAGRDAAGTPRIPIFLTHTLCHVF